MSAIRACSWVLVLMWLGAACGGSEGCTDDYNPTNPESCSYNRELAKLAHDRGANVGATSIETALGTKYLYLIVQPRIIDRGTIPRATFLNTSDRVVHVSPTYYLTWSEDDEREVMDACPFGKDPLVVEGQQESEALPISGCNDTDEALRTGFYEVVINAEVQEPDGLGRQVEIEAYFEVVG